MNNIYVPDDIYYDECYVLQGDGVIRGYDTVPRNNTSYNYRDYYINSNYMYRDGSGSWSQYTTLPVCLDDALITNNFYYRVDFYKILIMFLIFNIFCIYFPIKLFSKIFKKGGL